jgi:hypothetical protein
MVWILYDVELPVSHFVAQRHAPALQMNQPAAAGVARYVDRLYIQPEKFFVVDCKRHDLKRRAQKESSADL